MSFIGLREWEGFFFFRRFGQGSIGCKWIECNFTLSFNAFKKKKKIAVLTFGLRLYEKETYLIRFFFK